jgi:predicted aspartyl protease
LRARWGRKFNASYLPFSREGFIVDAEIFPPDVVDNQKSIKLKMLVDTGASISGISGEIAAKLCLPQVGIQEISTAGDIVKTAVFTGKVLFEPQHHWRKQQIQMMEVDLAEQEIYQGLIGRELLSGSMLTYIGFTGTCILSD